LDIFFPFLVHKKWVKYGFFVDFFAGQKYPKQNLDFLYVAVVEMEKIFRKKSKKIS